MRLSADEPGNLRSAAVPAAPPPVVVTGAGAVSALGIGCDALWSAVAAGRDGITPIERFPTEEFSVNLGAVVPGRNHPMDAPTLRRLCLEYAVLAAWEACEQAGLGDTERTSPRLALIMGTSLGDMETRIHSIAEGLARSLGLRGPCLTVSTACTSSAGALGIALDLLRDGTADLVLAGGADILSDTVFAGFHALGVLNREKCAPFGLPVGTTLGEGAGFLVLEREPDAARRGATPLAAIPGYGLSSDAYHATSPDPTGSGVSRAIEAALRHAGVPAAEVGYVNAHGSGTAANDRAEWQAIQRVFGERARTLPVSSVKSHLGHAQGAAGVLELIVTLLAMRRGLLPPTLHCERPRPHGPADPVAQDLPRPARYRHALCTSSAFGGANAAVVLSEAPPVREEAASTLPVAVLGIGAVGPHGRSLADFQRLLTEGAPRSREIPPLDLRDLVPTANPREVDDASRNLTTAAAQALVDAGVAIGGSLRDRAGLVVGSSSISVREAAAFHRSIDERGISRCSTTAFARMVLNAATGTAAKLLSLRGPTSTLTTGRDSGLVAITYAAWLLAARDDADLLVAGGLDALDDGSDDLGSDGAECLLLGRPVHSAAAGAGRPVMVAGWGLAGPGAVEEAAEQALARAGARPGDVELLLGMPRPVGIRAGGPEVLGSGAAAALASFGEASRSALACVAATLALRRGVAELALVVSGEGDSASCALLLQSHA